MTDYVFHKDDSTGLMTLIAVSGSEAALAAALQAEQSARATADNGINSLITQLRADMTQAQSDIKTLQNPPVTPPIPVVPPTPVVTEFIDFSNNMSGLYLPSSSLAGKGADVDIRQMKAMSSTKAAIVNALTSGQSNQCVLMRFGGLSSAVVPSGLDIGGFTLQATDQGHIYNGLSVGYSQGAKVHDVVVKGVAGTSSSPPGETFSVSGWHANGMRVNNVSIDGRDTTGKPVAASLFATNTQDDVIFDTIVGQYSAVGFGLTLWDSSNITVKNADLRFNRRALNVEQPHPGIMQFIGVDMRGQLDTANPHMTCTGTKGSTKYIITDPVVDKWPLRVGIAPLYNGVTNTQLISDVQLIVAGKDQTANPAYLMVGNVWGRSS